MRFPLVERSSGFRQPRDSIGPRVRMWRMILNGIDHFVEWTPYDALEVQAIIPGEVAASHPSWRLVCPLLCFAIVEWHQLGAIQHIPLRPLNIDIMHRHDGRWGRGEWYPTFLRGWYDMWRGRAQSRLDLDMACSESRPVRPKNREQVPCPVRFMVKTGRSKNQSTGQKPEIPFCLLLASYLTMPEIEYRRHRTWCNPRMGSYLKSILELRGVVVHRLAEVEDEDKDEDRLHQLGVLRGRKSLSRGACR
ncbi:hypothetical protein PIB30_100677 [Stylosanthes scabra]|uniref:Aminotransferase-like plant mobile domain-containing protein n=1 Tax=Stylosanthes scabra TaxID=79078 RepID=A0ABU6W0D1_9FABA|nr:hypothetical protein [Stylosanthes scabra]